MNSLTRWGGIENVSRRRASEPKVTNVTQTAKQRCSPSAKPRKIPALEAIAGVNYATGDLIICLEWYGDGPHPAPRWCKGLQGSLSKEEHNAIETMLNRALDARPKREQLAETEERDSDVDLSSYSEEDFFTPFVECPTGR